MTNLFNARFLKSGLLGLMLSVVFSHSAMAGGKMDVEALAKKWMESYSNKDFETHNAMIDPKVVVVYPEMAYMQPDRSAGAEFLLRTLEADEEAFLNLRQEVDKIYVSGDTAFVEGWFRGEKLGSTIVKQAKEQKMNFRFLHRIKFKNSKVVEVFSYYDTALPYQVQLGLQGPTKESPIPPWMMEMAKKQRSKQK
jgi:ketosteroid isomerase-like protein